jgi:hypothetical protein
LLAAASVIASTFAACGGSDVPPDVTMVSSLNPKQYVVDSLSVPMTRTDYSIDLNGDGKVDNQLGNIIGALSAQSLNTQDGVDKALAAGSVIVLMTQTSADPTYVQDNASGVQVAIGNAIKAPAMPDFSGMGMFTVDQALGGSVQFAGRINNSNFSSNSPVTTTHPVSVTLQLPLVAGSDPVQLKVIGGHIQFRYAGAGKLMSGQIHGAIRTEDVQNNIIPNVTQLLNQRVMMDPTTSTNKQILQIFDNGGEPDPSCAAGTCKNPTGCGTGCDGMCAMAKDGKIDVCEVSTNSIIKNVLNPDVQMFSADGTTYQPNAANTHKDSLSLGIAFTAVGATYQ